MAHKVIDLLLKVSEFLAVVLVLCEFGLDLCLPLALDWPVVLRLRSHLV